MSVNVVKGVAEEHYNTHVIRLNDTPHQEDRYDFQSVNEAAAVHFKCISIIK